MTIFYVKHATRQEATNFKSWGERHLGKLFDFKGPLHFSRHQFAADPNPTVPTLTEPAIPTNTILVSAKLHSSET